MSILLNRLQKALRPHARKGFTLTEVIVVLVVIAILAAILVPSFIALIRHGQQTNRDNIARTLYVAMQNQLTRATVEGNLRSMLTESFYDKDEYGNDQLRTSYVTADMVGRVSDSLGVYFPITDIENTDNVYYISKPAGYVFGSDEIVDDFYALLDEVIVNKEILDGAILMEFNVRTGVVMSIIYGDDLSGQIQFSYIGTGGNSYVVGERGMESAYPNLAKSRQQGYYGVDFTGVAPPLPIEDIVRIFDAMNYDDGTWQLTEPQGEPQYGLNVSADGSNPIRETNVLFAEFLLQNPLDEQRTLYVLDTNNKEAELLSFDGSDIYTDFRTAIEQSQYNNHAVYLDTDTQVVINQHGVDIGGIFNRYIWILDFIEEDIFTQPNNIVYKYSEITMPLNIRAGINVEDGPNIISPMYANTHFLDQWPDGTYEVNSVRHLNNIRYAQDGSFVQTNHIDMRTLVNEMIAEVNRTPHNFKPIENITGSYNATYESNQQWRIEYPRINTSDKSEFNNQNVGFFSNVNGNIVGISLFEAEIIAPNAENVGSIAGLLDGGQVIRSSSFANVVGGIGNTGGLIGHITNDSILSCSFNSGFFNTHKDTRTYYFEETASGAEQLVFIGTGSVMADGGNIGGLVGRNNGTILRCFSNARVNIEDVELDPDTLQSINPTSTATPLSGTNLGGIAGLNESTETIEDSYATNFVAIYSDSSINSGGIAGTNTGSIVNSRYIANGTTESEPEKKSLLREELSELGSGWLPTGFEINIDFHTAYYNEVHKNQYIQYPYPILSNNNPFKNIDDTIYNPLQENREMGWEDINSEKVIHAGALVYYEFYNDLAPRYTSPFLTTTIVSNGSSNIVTHDGYAIEFYPNKQGYILKFGDDHFYRVKSIDGVWKAQLIDDNTIDPIEYESWPITEFYPQINIPESNVTNPYMFRLHLPNDLALERMSSPVKVGLFPDTGVLISELRTEDNLLSRLDASGKVNEYDPMFANFSNTTNASIRSARHMDNINLVAGTNGRFRQYLNINYAIGYFEEVTISSSGSVVTDVNSIREFNRKAVITEQFNGTFIGDGQWISNLLINRPTDSNVGLFAENGGIIERVTLRLSSWTTDTIVGGTNVGGIVGNNLSSGTVRNCFVQQIVTRDGQGRLPTWTSHPAAVVGNSYVGGVVGYNDGTIADVSFMSSSARSAVQGTLTTTVGGIVGDTSTTIENVLYLAVAPRIGISSNTNRANMRPFTGSNINIGVNAIFLSGSTAIRPNQTVVEGIIPTNDYNVMVANQTFIDPTAKNTEEIIVSSRSSLFNANWTMNNTTGVNFEQMQTFQTYFYPYPIGTVPPSAVEWPIAATVVLPPVGQMGVVYYEIYWPSGTGIFARYIQDGVEITLDLLRYDNPVIVEAGYGAEVPSGFNLNPQRNVQYSQRAGGVWSAWEQLNSRQMSLSNCILNVPQLQGRTFVFFPPNLLFNAIDSAQNPVEPMIIIIPDSAAAGNPKLPAISAYINPFFAKEVYPVTLSGTAGDEVILNGNSTVPPVKYIQPTEHIIRTPWQMQNISLYNEMNQLLIDYEQHTFIQEIDLDMRTIPYTNAQNQNITGTGLGVNITRSANVPTNIAVQSTLSNIVRGLFYGIYDGQGNTISNLELTNPSYGSGNNTVFLNNKGLFNTIAEETIRDDGIVESEGIVQNLTLIDSRVQNGSNNGAFASVNNGIIRDVAFISAVNTSPATAAILQPITGTGATGGIVGTNNGEIENVLFLAQAQGATSIAPITSGGIGTETGAYYLSGSYSSGDQPTQPLVGREYNRFAPTIRGEPRTTQELNAVNGFSPIWKQSGVLPYRSTINAQNNTSANPYPYLAPVAINPVQNWPAATIPALGVVYFEEYDNGSVGFDFDRNNMDLINLGLPALTSDDEVLALNVGYAVMIDRAGEFGVSMNVNAGSNMFVSSIGLTNTDGRVFNCAIIPNVIIKGIEGQLFVNDYPTGWFIVHPEDEEDSADESFEELSETIDSEENPIYENDSSESQNNNQAPDNIDNSSDFEAPQDESSKNETPVNENTESKKSDIDNDLNKSDEDCIADPIEDPIEDSTSSNDVAIVTGVISLFGGYTFTQTRLFKGYMRKRNARAVRKINEYNKNKRNGHRVDRYILRYYEKNNRRGGVNDANNKNNN